MQIQVGCVVKLKSLRRGRDGFRHRVCAHLVTNHFVLLHLPFPSSTNSARSNVGDWGLNLNERSVRLSVRPSVQTVSVCVGGVCAREQTNVSAAGWLLCDESTYRQTVYTCHEIKIKPKFVAPGGQDGARDGASVARASLTRARDDVVLGGVFLDPASGARRVRGRRRWMREQESRCETDDVCVRTEKGSRKSERGRPKRAGDEGVDVVQRC